MTEEPSKPSEYRCEGKELLPIQQFIYSNYSDSPEWKEAEEAFQKILKSPAISARQQDFYPVCIDRICAGLFDVCPVIAECDMIKECKAHREFLKNNPDVIRRNAKLGERASLLEEHDAVIAQVS